MILSVKNILLMLSSVYAFSDMVFKPADPCLEYIDFN